MTGESTLKTYWGYMAATIVLLGAGWGTCYKLLVMPRSDRIDLLEDEVETLRERIVSPELHDDVHPEVTGGADDDAEAVLDVSGLWRTHNMEEEVVYDIQQDGATFLMVLQNPEAAEPTTIKKASGVVRGRRFELEPQYKLSGEIDVVEGGVARRITLDNGVILMK